MGISSPLLPLLSSCNVLPSRRNWWRSGLGLSSGRSKAARLHQPSMSWYHKRHLCFKQGWLDPPLQPHLLHSNCQLLQIHTPSTKSSTSLSTGPAGERNPESSTTQLVISPVVESVSVLGLKLSFGEDIVADGPAAFWRSFTGTTAVVSSSWREKLTILTV